MKLFTLTLTLFFICFFSFSQKKTKEFGLNIYNVNSYGMQYKIGEDATMWRFRLNSSDLILGREGKMFSFNFDNGNQIRTRQVNLTAAIGREKRKEIAPNFQFIYGMELLTRYSYRGIADFNFITDFKALSVGLSAVVGARYALNDKIFIGAELLPSVQYVNSKTINRNRRFFGASDITRYSGIFAGFDSSSALLSIGIKF